MSPAALPVAERRAVADRDLARSQADLGAPAYAWQALVCGLRARGTPVGLSSPTPRSARSRASTCTRWPGPRPAAASPCRCPSARSRVPSPCRALAAPRRRWRPTSPGEHSCPDGLLGPSTFDASRLLRGARPTSLSSSPTWLVITTATPVSSTDLGCDPWKISLLRRPRRPPVPGRRRGLSDRLSRRSRPSACGQARRRGRRRRAAPPRRTRRSPTGRRSRP